MKNYKVDIDFKKGVGFAANVGAINEADAQKRALKLAKDCGFDAPVKKITITEEATA